MTSNPYHHRFKRAPEHGVLVSCASHTHAAELVSPTGLTLGEAKHLVAQVRQTVNDQLIPPHDQAIPPGDDGWRCWWLPGDDDQILALRSTPAMIVIEFDRTRSDRADRCRFGGRRSATVCLVTRSVATVVEGKVAGGHRGSTDARVHVAHAVPLFLARAHSPIANVVPPPLRMSSPRGRS